MREQPDLVIIGPGKVGTSIALLASKHGYRVAAIAGRDREKAYRAAQAIERKPKVCEPVEAVRAGELILLTVSDDAIGPLCTELAEKGAFSQGQMVAHLSGALSSEVLKPAHQLCGAEIGSFHPLQMFPSVDAALADIPGSHWFCEGESNAVAALEELVKKIGGIPHIITAANKALYHCASVVACNYLNALMDVSLRVAELAGLDRETAWQALLPLVQSTITNIDKFGASGALTGPIERGDVETVQRHLQALKDHDADITEIYRELGKWTVRLAEQKATLNRKQISQLNDLLNDRSGEILK